MPFPKVKEAETPKKVIVYRKELLWVSETFIMAQVQSYQRWQPVLFGERIWPGGLSLDGIDSRTLMDARPTLVQRIVVKARQETGVAPAFVKRKFRAAGADLLHAHFGHDGLLACPYARNLNVPLVVTLHGRDVDIRKEVYWSGERGFWQKSYPNRFAVMARQRSVHFIAVSKALLQAAIDFGVYDHILSEA